MPTKFLRHGIRYDELSEEEKDDWDALEWDEDGDVPDAVSAEELNRFLFNADTVDKVLATLMANGHKVAGGDRLGKTIVFAKNQGTPSSSSSASTSTTPSTPATSPGSSPTR